VTRTERSRRSAPRRRGTRSPPCNLSLDRLAKAVKNGVHAAGGYPLEFGTNSVSDGIAMGHEGMHFSVVRREVIADSVETVMMAERLDGSALLAGCDSRCPAC
jgi:dihydroxy-acid dehydratase